VAETLLIIVLVILGVIVALQLVQVLRRAGSADAASLAARLEAQDKSVERLERAVRDELGKNREEGATQARGLREEIGHLTEGNQAAGKELRAEVQVGMKTLADSLLKQMGEITTLQKNQLETLATRLEALTKAVAERLDSARETVANRLREIQEDNRKSLDAMRQTVDQKLQDTLEKRLGESFRIVSERLEQVHKGLGEMQTLASGVGDLKKVLSNVKTRGTWGEMQLGNLLEQVLTTEQFARNVATRPGSNERVEFAIRLPGRDSRDGGPVWLPIDAKFPVEDYQRLVEAAEQGDGEAAEAAGRQIERQLRCYARDIHDKYIDPPNTTDFGLMFLPTEGLYAEALRRPGLAEALQHEFRVVVAGPTTLAALLNSLQMGFRTLAIEKRSSEVWQVLGAVKTEFAKFGEAIDKVSKKLEEASNVVGAAQTRKRAMDRSLRAVQELSAPAAEKLLGEGEGEGE